MRERASRFWPSSPGARRRREVAAVAALSLVLGAAFSYPMLTSLSIPSGLEDWDQFEAFSLVPYLSLRNFHQFPLWNPYKCGGMPALGNPQFRIITPFLFLHLLIGPIAGLRIETLLYFAIAWAGGYVLARVVGVGRIAACGAATVFPASSWYALHLTAGHLEEMSFAWMPWVLAFTIIASQRRELRYCTLAGASFALTFLDSQGYSTVYTLLVLAAVTAALALRRGGGWPLIAFVVTVALGAGLAPIKLLPAIDFIRGHPRPIDYAEINNYRLLGRILLSRNQDFHMQLFDSTAPYRWGYWEFGAYVGLFVVPAIVGIFATLDALPWIVAAVLMLLVWRGSPGALWPWALLHHLPVFSSMRVPSRAIIPFTLTVGVLAGFGLDWIVDRSRRYGRVICVVLIAVATLDCLVVTTPNYRYAISTPESELHNLPEGGFHQVFRVVPYHEFEYALHGQGARFCHEPSLWRTSVKGYDQSGYLGEQYMVDGGDVRLLRWMPNELEYEVDTPSASRLVVNQNYDRSWKLVEGDGEVFEFSSDPDRAAQRSDVLGLLAVRVPSGLQKIRLRYRPSSFTAGAAISTATLLGCFLIWFLPRRRSLESGQDAA